ncbi:MAG: 4-amino-4-deoxychorismate lyase [Paraglaciecola sp.]|jgi:4-amino-4-deoxychorismate lyase
MIVNGQQQQHIEIADRAFQYGDGCFTTMAFRNGRLELFDAHINRLKLACNTLYINFDKWSELESCIVDSLKADDDCVIKVIITRGVGGRGYSPEGAITPSFIITHHTIPVYYPVWQTKGIKLTISPITLARQPLLAGIKHLNRLEQVLVKQDLAQTNYDDAVVCDTQQKIIETSIGNLFWFKDNTWYTSDLSESGVEGVMRNLVLDVMLEKGMKCRVVKHDVSILFNAQQLFVCNALMMLVPVVSLFSPTNQKIREYFVDQSKHLQRYIQHSINLRTIKI